MSRHSSGFTLIEVLVATAITVTVAAASAQLLTVAVRHDVGSRQQLALMAGATAKLDELAAIVTAAAVAPSAAGDLDHSMAGCSDVVTVSGVTMERRWVVAPLTALASSAVALTVRAVPAAALAARPVEIATIAEVGAR